MNQSVASGYARPSNWQDFERVSTALLSDVHGTRMRRWGSAGQRKDGVDAWATLPDGRIIAARLEGRTDHYAQPLAKADIDTALSEVASFPHPLAEFILLSAGPDDAGLQAYAATLSANRQATGKSSVAVWGWQTISSQISAHPKVRDRFYGREGGSSLGKKLTLLAAALLVVAGGAGSLFLGKNAIDASRAKPENPAANVGGIAANLDELNGTYRQCLALLGKDVFTFSRELIDTCRDPAAAQLAALSKKVDKQRSGFDQQTQAELSRLLVIFHEDVREAAAVTAAAHAFDNDVVQAMKDRCGAGAKSQPDEAAVRRAGNQAVAAEVRYYYLLRDFIIPEMAVAKEILQLHASGKPAPEQMQAAAGRMEQLLTERTKYTPGQPRWPFMLSSMKQTLARDAALGAEQRNDGAEEEYWRGVLAQAATQSLRGRAKDIDALIACGALKEDARALARPGT
ncbi:hypothetical protein [Massilia sp. METH4]|uniref:hypothetical protein n=1 Tax=Massilia sp. METH4 TaxID=3123041 RepID=UPI0030D011F8